MIDRKKSVGAEGASRHARAEARRSPPAAEGSGNRIAELVEAVKARDEFISVAAHELRNPMTAILMQVQQLAAVERRAGAGGVTSGLERLERLVEAYIKRVTTLLDVSRMTSGKHHLELSEVDLSALIRKVAAEQSPAAEFAECSLFVSVQDGIVGLLDPLGVEQIAENLLNNAIKYGAGEPVEVALSREGDTARLRVRDHGVGISQEAQTRLYLRFERAVLQSQHSGFGVGLWIVGRLVDAMDGAISVASKSGEGSTFTVTLPLKANRSER